MIKVAILLTRSEQADPRAFLEEWEQAGLAIAERLAPAEGARRYARNVALSSESPLASAPPSPFAGVDEYWFDGTEDAADHFGAHGHGLEAMSTLDLAGCLEVAGPIHVLHDGRPHDEPSPTKVFVGGCRRPDLTVAEYRHRWIEQHGPLALANPDGRQRLQRLEYCPADPESFTGLSGGPFDGTASIWLTAGPEQLLTQMQSRYYQEVLGPDERRFTDPERSFAVIAGERFVWERGPLGVQRLS